MKRNSIFAVAIAILSVLDGYLLSGISLVGRTGISVFYRQFGFLKSWWKVGLLVFLVWMILLFIQLKLKEKLPHNTFLIVEFLFMAVSLAGWYLSYSDFHQSLSHRLLGQRFHMGVYLFWLGMLAISLFQLTKNRTAFQPTSTMDT